MYDKPDISKKQKRSLRAALKKNRAEYKEVAIEHNNIVLANRALKSTKSKQPIQPITSSPNEYMPISESPVNFQLLSPQPTKPLPPIPFKRKPLPSIPQKVKFATTSGTPYASAPTLESPVAYTISSPINNSLIFI